MALPSDCCACGCRLRTVMRCCMAEDTPNRRQPQHLRVPAKLLQGSGNQARSMNVEGASTLARPEVARLIDEAIARNPVPFAPAGRGSVVIRSTSAKQRRRRPA